MPHIILEYSQDTIPDNVVKTMVSSAYDAVKSTGLFDEANLKVRAHPVTHYQLGLLDCGFIHVMCRIHSGKTDEQKRLLTQTVLKNLEGLFKGSVVITVEVVDMDKSTYAKALVSGES
ncbi:hypothetical protein QCB45_01960 [Thiomicrorhabdus sp. ZW0627]|uniref:5-carboxymethyl-2-hydroxymuconate Delta-isomerase n=1 Tax=Thiomicrorhabdus sp. ZW0627 TaxID=3039774 RepID=UPI00243642A5|nr:hypothetical protein [Thiomicrorhabdus sp. ZW0627]MDG6773079.1 hypothetical protein [Thiomicrorhabdus sp. ZW0627]